MNTLLRNLIPLILILLGIGFVAYATIEGSLAGIFTIPFGLALSSVGNLIYVSRLYRQRALGERIFLGILTIITTFIVLFGASYALDSFIRDDNEKPVQRPEEVTEVEHGYNETTDTIYEEEPTVTE